MATAVTLPKLGNTAESALLVRWHKAVGESIKAGEVLCEVETDKAMMEVPSPVSGTVLALHYQPNEEIPVMVAIAEIGESPSPPTPLPQRGEGRRAAVRGLDGQADDANKLKISPRARQLAAHKQIEVSALGINGSGPGGRIIERDIQQAVANGAKWTPLARAMVESGDFALAENRDSADKRITKSDLVPVKPMEVMLPLVAPMPESEEVERIPLVGVRKTIAARMLESLQTTAQLTLNTPADATAIRAFRNRLKNSPAALGLQIVTINDLILFTVTRTLIGFPELNSLFHNGAIHRHKSVALGFAVDTPRGLIVPVIHHAERLGLKALSDEAHRLSIAANESRIQPDELRGGTFTVTNLGSLGVESFTPILNLPQVGILGVGAIYLKPIEHGDEVKFVPHFNLSLTINHQIVDGAPGARFLQALAKNLMEIDVLVAV